MTLTVVIDTVNKRAAIQIAILAGVFSSGTAAAAGFIMNFLPGPFGGLNEYSCCPIPINRAAGFAHMLPHTSTLYIDRPC